MTTRDRFTTDGCAGNGRRPPERKGFHVHSQTDARPFRRSAAATILPQVRSARLHDMLASHRLAEVRRAAARQRASGALEKRLEAKGVSDRSGDEFTSGRRCSRLSAPRWISASPAMRRRCSHRWPVAIFSMSAPIGDLRPSTGCWSRRIRLIQKLEDSKGKKVAYKRGSSAHNFALKVLAKAGLVACRYVRSRSGAPDAGGRLQDRRHRCQGDLGPVLCGGRLDPQTRVLTTSEGLLDNRGYFLGNGVPLPAPIRNDRRCDRRARQGRRGRPGQS